MSTPRDPWDGGERRPGRRGELPPELDPRGRAARRPGPTPPGPYGPPRGRAGRPGARPGLPPDLDPRGREQRLGPADPGGPGPGGPAGWDPYPVRRRHPALAALRVLGAALSVLVLVTSGLMWFLYRDFTGNIGRVNAIGATADDVDGRDQNILLVGSDDRSTATDAELRELSTTRVTSNSTDTMMLVHVPADGRKATAISFPRDSWVEIPGHGTHKLNSAYVRGAGTGSDQDPDKGRQLLVQTISELSGLHIDHYVEVDLLGFYRITKAVGGVEVCLNAAQREKDSGIDLPAGKSTIEGKQALAFVRQRKGLPRGDLDRIVRQQYFLGATFNKVTSLGVLTNPIKLKRLLDAVGSSMRMDEDLDPLQLARQVRGLAAGNVEFKTVPTAGTGTRDGQSVVLLDEAKLPDFFRTVAEPPPARAAVKLVPRDQVTVDVFNGTGRAGLAGTTATALRTAGFTVGGAGNADRRDYARTEIRYDPSREAQARTLAAAVSGATLVERDGIGDSVHLVLGSGFAGVKGAGGGSGPAGGSGSGSGGAASTAPAGSGSS
ncbi:MAG TPA: LCP family protein, partial [Mycobacteriales bacterium]|nr:LCP family protein [Mycobacteriales bacterium]